MTEGVDLICQKVEDDLRWSLKDKTILEPSNVVSCFLIFCVVSSANFKCDVVEKSSSNTDNDCEYGYTMKRIWNWKVKYDSIQFLGTFTITKMKPRICTSF